jgi:hypothetical protein
MVTAQRSRATKAAAWQEALRQWLQWNEAYEQLTTRMFQAKGDPGRLESLADELDRVRERAVAASRELLKHA